MSINVKKKIEFVYDLPYAERMELCKILDLTDKWEILASLMGYDVMTIRTFRRARQSPTDELLTEWGHRNGTILKLFGFLSQMQHYQAMLTIKKFVDPEFHRLIYEGKGMLSQTKRQCAADCDSISKGAMSVNFNQSNSCNTLPSKMDGIRMTASSGSESKILNVDGVGAAAAVQPRRGSGTSQNSTLAVNNNNNDVRRSPTGDSSKARGSPDIPLAVDSGPPMIKYKELELATNGWDPASVLGKGGFGIVYKGTWKNTPVAVKRTLAKDVDGSATIQMQQILAELRMLNAYRHDSILPLYGFSVDGEDPCLIYQFLPNGSLEDRLLCRQGTAPLTWTQRLHISTETARGLQWLHTIKDKPLIHGDIKSANILLDSNFQPKIGDFGLAREGPQSQYTHMKISKIHGTRPYLPDEFLRARKFSTKVDTHCFGIVLFELATGLRPYDDQRNHKYLRDLIEQSSDSQITHLVDRKALPSDPHVFLVLIDLGRLCVKHKPKDRPEMVSVWEALERATGQRARAQQQAAQAGPRAVSPFDLQQHYDRLTQQRNNGVSPIPRMLSPSPDNRVPSPGLEFLQYPIAQPGGGRISPLVSPTGFPQVNSISPVANYAIPTSPRPAEPRLMPASPQIAATPILESRTADMPSQSAFSMPLLPATLMGHAAAVGSPVIAVTPPTDSSASTHMPSFETTHSIITTDELSMSNNTVHQSNTFDESCYNIPNIAALGIAGEVESPASGQEGARSTTSVPTTAKGKTLWIMNGCD